VTLEVAANVAAECIMRPGRQLLA